MGFDLAWMRPDAPYMPIATAGLLSVLDEAGVPARARWGETLQIETELALDEVAELVAGAALPDVDRVRPELEVDM